MFATRMRGKSRKRLLSLALAGGMALSATTGATEALVTGAPAVSSVTTATAASSQQGATASVPAVPFIGFSAVTSASAYSSWAAVPGHRSYAMRDFRGDPNAASFGQCTWYAWDRHRRLPLMGMGNAGAWPANAGRFGLRVSSQPRVGATAVFAPGVQGASAAGHVGVVERLLRGGWLMISEMNFFWNGGGWGRVDYRYVHVGSGVSFIS